MSTMPPVFSPDSRDIFYVLQDYKNNKSIVFVSDTTTGEVRKTMSYDNISGVVFSPDGKWFTYAARRGGKQFVVVSGFSEEEKEGSVYEAVGSTLISPDGRHIAYIAEKQGKQFLVISNRQMEMFKEGQGSDRIYQTVFTTDGRFVVYQAQSGEEILWKVETVE